MAKEKIEPTTYWLLNTEKFQAPARVRTHHLLAGKAISEVEIKKSFSRIFKKKRVTDHDFPPPFMWAENNNLENLIKMSGTNYLFLFAKEILDRKSSRKNVKHKRFCISLDYTERHE